jgi:chitinase
MSQRCLFVVLFLIAVTVIGNSKQFHVLQKRDNCASCTASAPCCSQYGFCGSTADYCGVGCQSGPCTGSSSEDDDNDNGTGIITKAIFRCAFPLLNASLLHRRFGGLKKTGWSPANIVAGAVFLAHVSHETDGLRTLVEYCAATNGTFLTFNY